MVCPSCKAHFDNAAFCPNDGTALVEEGHAGLVGQVFADRYRIVRLLGEGGMGQVYEAKHLHINKRFALKMLRPEVIGSAQSLQRFRQEAWAASSIGHENIVEIDDFATLPSGQVYLAMEFLDGQSLAERIRDGAPLAVQDAVAMMIAVGHGLAAAHGKGIVHRDMKPENVFLARKNGRVVAKILDFGIAKMTGGDEPAASHLTRTGAIFGTPLYMSPEQARGRPADARADVYAVGVILYELLTGSVPFGGESSVEILNQHISAAPVPPTKLAPERGIPPALEALVLRALAKEPEARFASMAELVQALEAVAATLPAPQSTQLAAMPASSSGRAITGASTGPTAAAARGAAPSRPAISRPVVVPSLAAVEAGPRGRGARNAGLALVALLLAAGLTWLLVPRRQSPPQPQPQPAPAPPPAPTPPAPSKPQPPREIEVILDSQPTGAKIVRDGAVVAETPEALKLTGSVTVVLKKDAYADKSVVVDPAGAHKLVVKLERAKPVAAKTPSKPRPEPTMLATPAPQPGEPPETPAPPPAAKPAPAPPKPAAPKLPPDELGTRVDQAAMRAVPGGHRVGAIYRGAAVKEGGRSDWFVDLESGRCYTFVGEGGDGVKGLYLYLWGPHGRRVHESRVTTAHAQMTFCTQIPGNYHVQAKVADGRGEYRVGIYTR